MPARFDIGGRTVMGSDGMRSGQPRVQGLALSATVSSDGDAERPFAARPDGGDVQLSAETTFRSHLDGLGSAAAPGNCEEETV
jgi:uncharacterized glyoxalase superfamily protein PhnB